jgi:hypothetical protein
MLLVAVLRVPTHILLLGAAAGQEQLELDASQRKPVNVSPEPLDPDHWKTERVKFRKAQAVLIQDPLRELGAGPHVVSRLLVQASTPFRPFRSLSVQERGYR